MLSRILTSVALAICITACAVAADPTDQDFSEVAPASKNLEFLSDIFAFKGRPLNLDEDRPVTVLINHGYMIGFSADRKQPVWAAYRVSSAKQATNFTRPPFFYDDQRLPKTDRIGTDTFKNGFDRGHMVPNFAINKTYGKLGQLETFLMSNICPQKANLNQGLWQRLEHRIVEDYAAAWDHIWVICGPTFEEDLGAIRGMRVPSHFYMILVDVHGRQSKSTDILCMKFPQNTPRGAEVDLEKHVISINALEQTTKFNFFPQFGPQSQAHHEKDKAEEVWKVESEE